MGLLEAVYPEGSGFFYFDTFVRSWEDWQDLSYDRSMSFAVRHKLSDRICTTNEGKVR